MVGFEGINLLAVLAAGAAAFVIGSLWYTVFFGKLWMKLAEVKKQYKDSYMPVRFLVYLLVQLVMAFVLAHFLIFTNAVTYLEGLTTVFWLWLGFIAPITIGGVLWEKKSINLFVLNNAYNLIAMGVMSVILIACK